MMREMSLGMRAGQGKMTMIICNDHGMQGALSVSPDLKKLINSQQTMKPYRIIEYEYLGDITHIFHVSIEYAKKYELPDEAILPLPDDYPEWVMSLVRVCEKCFEARLG